MTPRPGVETQRVVEAGGKVAARAAARLLTLQSLLHLAGDAEAATVAAAAGEACTRLLVATHDGPNEVFACRR